MIDKNIKFLIFDKNQKEITSEGKIDEIQFRNIIESENPSNYYDVLITMKDNSINTKLSNAIIDIERKRMYFEKNALILTKSFKERIDYLSSLGWVFDFDAKTKPI